MVHKTCNGQTIVVTEVAMLSKLEQGYSAWRYTITMKTGEKVEIDDRSIPFTTLSYCRSELERKINEAYAKSE